MSISLKKSGMLKLGLSLGRHDRRRQRASENPRFIVLKARRKDLTHSSSPLAPPMMPAPYRSITAPVEFKTGTTEVIPRTC